MNSEKRRFIALHEWITEHNEEALTADGFDEAVIGMCQSFGKPPVVAYDRDKCIDILVQNGCDSYEEAEEYFEFNVAGSYVGEHTPVFLTLFSKLKEGVCH